MGSLFTSGLMPRGYMELVADQPSRLPPTGSTQAVSLSETLRFVLLSLLRHILFVKLLFLREHSTCQQAAVGHTTRAGRNLACILDIWSLLARKWRDRHHWRGEPQYRWCGSYLNPPCVYFLRWSFGPHFPEHSPYRNRLRDYSGRIL